MSREIKFKCWYKDEMFHGMPLVKILEMAAETKSPKSGEIDGAIFLQYTGLKDNNGVEIYEGDVVESTCGDNYEVKYNKSSAQFITDNCTDYMQGDLYQVIGNIYENPELLNS